MDDDILEILAVHGDRALARRTKNNETKVGEVRKISMEEGKPLPTKGELFTLEEREGEHLRYNVRSLYGDRKGPARVSTPSYRKGWDDVFGAVQKPEGLN